MTICLNINKPFLKKKTYLEEEDYIFSNSIVHRTAEFFFFSFSFSSSFLSTRGGVTEIIKNHCLTEISKQWSSLSLTLFFFFFFPKFITRARIDHRPHLAPRALCLTRPCSGLFGETLSSSCTLGLCVKKVRPVCEETQETRRWERERVFLKITPGSATTAGFFARVPSVIGSGFDLRTVAHTWKSGAQRGWEESRGHLSCLPHTHTHIHIQYRHSLYVLLILDPSLTQSIWCISFIHPNHRLCCYHQLLHLRSSRCRLPTNEAELRWEERRIHKAAGSQRSQVTGHRSPTAYEPQVQQEPGVTLTRLVSKSVCRESQY